jgi:hypothetical protein
LIGELKGEYLSDLKIQIEPAEQKVVLEMER